MRELVLRRLEELREINSRFAKNSARWKGSYVTVDGNKQHLADVNFKNFADNMLVKALEYIVVQAQAQID